MVLKFLTVRIDETLKRLDKRKKERDKRAAKRASQGRARRRRRNLRSSGRWRNRGDTYHFDVVANESARGVMDVMLEFGVPVANGILTTDDERQAAARLEKGAEAVRVAVEMARLKSQLHEAR